MITLSLRKWLILGALTSVILCFYILTFYAAIQMRIMGGQMQSMASDPLSWPLVYVLPILGAIIALGKILAEESPLTVRLVCGRLIIGAAVSLSAIVFLALMPTASNPVILGIGVIFGVLGKSSLEKIFNRLLALK